MSNNLEEKLLQTILNFCKENNEEQNNNDNSLNKIRDIKISKKLKKIHLGFLNMIKEDKINRVSEEDIQVRNKY